MNKNQNFTFKSQATQQAFFWITNILQKNQVTYQISGGLATRLYGASRPLADIDIDLSNQAIVNLYEEIQPYVIYGPTRYKTIPWDIFLTTIAYHGQEIDLCGIDDAYVFNQKTKQWTPYLVDFSATTMMSIEAVQVPIINKMALIKYKSMLGRDVDILDVNELSS